MPGGRHSSCGGGGVHRARARIHPCVKHKRSSSPHLTRKEAQHTQHLIHRNTQWHVLRSVNYTRDTLTEEHATRQTNATATNELPRAGGPTLRAPPDPHPNPRMPIAAAVHIFSTRIFRRQSSCLRNTLVQSEIYALIDTYYLGIFWKGGECYVLSDNLILFKKKNFFMYHVHTYLN